MPEVGSILNRPVHGTTIDFNTIGRSAVIWLRYNVVCGSGCNRNLPDALTQNPNTGRTQVDDELVTHSLYYQLSMTEIIGTANVYSSPIYETLAWGLQWPQRDVDNIYPQIMEHLLATNATDHSYILHPLVRNEIVVYRNGGYAAIRERADLNDHLTLSLRFWARQAISDRHGYHCVFCLSIVNPLEVQFHPELGTPVHSVCLEAAEDEDSVLCRHCDPPHVIPYDEAINPEEEAVIDGPDVYMCMDAYDRYVHYCEICDRQIYGTCACRSLDIHSYSYVPVLQFHPPIPESSHPLYIGMEIETEFGINEEDFAAIFNDVFSEYRESFFYCKSDSSIDYGVEIVTHPFSPAWGLKHIHWEGFERLINAGVPAKSESCGQHIHLSKSAFTSAHLWKFLQLHQRQADFCTRIGGRNSTRWASFGSDWTNMRPHIKDFAKDKYMRRFVAPRYSAVNLNPENTIELRYPAGTIKPTLIRKNIEWVDAIYDYTQQLTVTQVRNGAMDDPGTLVWFIGDNRDRWPNLDSFVRRLFPTPRSLHEFSS